MTAEAGTEPIRFHLDEHMDPVIAIELRRANIDVTTTVDAGLRTGTDESHLDFARANGRVLVTDDVDFLAFARTSSEHSGIVFCRRLRHPLGEIIRFLELVHGVYDASEMRGRVEYLG